MCIIVNNNREHFVHSANGRYEKIGVVFLLLYSFSRLSWGFIIPSIGWGIIMLMSIFFFSMSIVQKEKKTSSDSIVILLFIMLAIITFNNYSKDYSNIGFWIGVLPYFCVAFQCICCSKSEQWINIAIIMIVFWGCFYAVFTIICFFDSSIYYNTLYPIMYPHYYLLSYTPNPMAGFTAHYSTNGIFLSIPLLACLSFFFSGVHKQKRFNYFLIASMILLAFIICGKRGIILSVFGAVFLAYYSYNADKKRSRGLKTITILAFLFFLIYVLSLFLPSISALLDRFRNLSNDNNVNQRFLVWDYTIEGFKNCPFFGNGWRWVMNTNPILIGADSHNVYLQLLAEVGIIGAIPFYLFFIIMFVRAAKLSSIVRIKKEEFTLQQQRNIFFAYMMISYNIIYMIEGTSFYMPECLVPFFISCSIVLYYWNYAKSKLLV